MQNSFVMHLSTVVHEHLYGTLSNTQEYNNFKC